MGPQKAGMTVAFSGSTGIKLTIPKSGGGFDTYSYDAVDQESWIQGFVNSGANVTEEISALVSSAKSIHEFTALNIDKISTLIASFQPKVCLVVNVASK